MRTPENFEPRRHCESESVWEFELESSKPHLSFPLISHRAQAKEKQRHSLRTRMEEDSRVVQDENELSDDVDAWFYDA